MDLKQNKQTTNASKVANLDPAVSSADPTSDNSYISRQKYMTGVDESRNKTVYSTLDKEFRTDNPFQDSDLKNIVWNMIDQYFQGPDRLTQHHLHSFNHFINISVPKIIKESNPIVIKGGFVPTSGRYSIKYIIEFGNVYIGTPCLKENDGTTKIMFPSEARWRNLTYSSDISVDIHHKMITYTDTGEEIVKVFDTLKQISLRSIPIMIKSEYCVLSCDQSGKLLSELGECEYEKGGYFIVKGAEKVLISQEKKFPNKLLCFSKNKSQTQHENKIEINSISRHNSTMRFTHMFLDKKAGKKLISINLQPFKSDKPFPLFIVFRALGVETDKNIVELILYNYKSAKNKESFEILKDSLYEARSIRTQEMALLYLSNFLPKQKDYKDNSEIDDKHKINTVIELIETFLFPHVGTDLMRKAWFLGMMAKKLLYTHVGILKYDDRDSFINKGIATSGELMEDLYRSNFIKLVRDIEKYVESDIRQRRYDEVPTTILKKIKTNNIESNIRLALSTGTWGMKSQSNQTKKGIAQPLSRLSYASYISNLRRVHAPRAEKGGKITEPRKLHSTQWSKFCCSESPDGHVIGVVKNLSLQAMITIESDDEPIISILEEEKITMLENVTPMQMDQEVRIFINGNPIGCTDEPDRVIGKLRHLRRSGLYMYISITWNILEQEINILTSGGRIIRPVFIVSNNRLVITPEDFVMISEKKKSWNDLLFEGKIEYLDSCEEDTAMIAMSYNDLLNNSQDNEYFKTYTHAEIHPALIFGAVVCTIPFAENNYGPRIAFEAAQKKQAICGSYTTNYRSRMDTSGMILRYAQLPIVSTRSAKYVHERDIPSGQNIIVAINCFKGFNQEDSIIFNESSLARGLLESVNYRTYKDNERKNQASLDEERFCKPVKYNSNGTLRTIGTNSASYNLLDDNGFIKVGSYVKNGDVLIGKVVPLKNTTESGPKFKDASKTVTENTTGVVDCVYVNRDSDGYQFAKIRVRSKRTPNIGDKFTSRYGQKGTIGQIFAQENLPTTAEGITPDIIINPHAIPTRMTIGQLLECVSAKSAATYGYECDMTPFSSNSADTPAKLAEILKTAGYTEDGTEYLYNGCNGVKLKTKIFIGPTYYRRLKHMSEDKIHARGTGPLQLLTRQPPEGRKRDGGLRFGEMERDSMLGHATSGFIKERFFNSSDKHAVYICDMCGRIAISNSIENIFVCTYCPESTSFNLVFMPYCAKLLVQELHSMGLDSRIFVNHTK